MGSSISGTTKRTVNPQDERPASEMPRRILHGNTPRQTAGTPNYQPQDGVTESSRRITDIASRLLSGRGETEDARLTGGTRSLMRRLSGLNIPRALSIPARSVSNKVSMGNAKVA